MVALATLIAGTALGEVYRGIEFPCAAASFADSVVEFKPGLPMPDRPYRGAWNAVGIPDEVQPVVCPSVDGCSYASLGSGGSLTLGFVDNVLVADGTEAADLWVFEVGPLVEIVRVEVSKDGFDWIPVGEVVGDRTGVDLDANGFGPEDEFRFVRLTDDPDSGGMSGPAVGADIDAVGAISCRRRPPDLPASFHRSRLIAWGQHISAYTPQPPGESVPAIEAAYERHRFDGVEMDLRITGDGVPVLLHDDVIGSQDAPFVVSEHTFQELQEFYPRVSWYGVSVGITTLEEALRANGDRGLFLADMRIPSREADKVKRAVEAAAFPLKNLEITTYTLTQGQVYKRALPGAQVVVKQYAFARDIPRSWVDEVAAAGLDGVMFKMPRNGESIRDFVAYAHWKGLTVTTFVHYDRNPFEELQGLVEDGVDNILTVHSGYRELLAWPAPVSVPRLQVAVSDAKDEVEISWAPFPLYAFLLQASEDAIHWRTVRAEVDTTEAPDRLIIRQPLAGSLEFYRLATRP